MKEARKRDHETAYPERSELSQQLKKFIEDIPNLDGEELMALGIFLKHLEQYTAYYNFHLKRKILIRTSLVGVACAVLSPPVGSLLNEQLSAVICTVSSVWLSLFPWAIWPQGHKNDRHHYHNAQGALVSMSREMDVAEVYGQAVPVYLELLRENQRKIKRKYKKAKK
jgi:hypothetical protein